MYKSFILIPLLFISTLVFAKGDYPVTAKSAVLMNCSNKRVLYSRGPYIKLAPASTVKIMTAIVVLKNSKLDRKVRVSGVAASMPPSKIHLKKGEVYLTKDLLKALLLNSGNDASVALAESVAGTEENFVKMMNDTAKRIGAKHTNFRTSNGLPAKGQYSTAYDMAIIMREASRYKTIMDIMGMRNAEIRELDSGRCIKLRNHNKSLWKDKSYDMLGKTGYTFNAKHCFVGYIDYGGKKKIVVVLLKSKRLWRDLESLAEKGKFIR